ncbi:hypothetical protein LWC34_22725 [Kibdelosporangium philippinense]|uniref:Uncharacterized protein n=1 Tax=Kibdelosporangium philippinense TaxID=211113 RepID=A0ABS8ZEC5_9PSEU|nr:hypothetical protein [Kibdelosporangium philippinense]MCE7005619.1 hypothetical protein [Kibdelosporangium philippinense]
MIVFPIRDRADVEAMLDAISPGQNEPWLVDGNLYVYITAPGDEYWELDEIVTVIDAVGEWPDWAVGIDVSGRIDGTEEVRRLVLALLDRGGVGFDDFSEHAWTAAEIESGARFEGLSFFDFRGYHESKGVTR